MPPAHVPNDWERGRTQTHGALVPTSLGRGSLEHSSTLAGYETVTAAPPGPVPGCGRLLLKYMSAAGSSLNVSADSGRPWLYISPALTDAAAAAFCTGFGAPLDPNGPHECQMSELHRTVAHVGHGAVICDKDICACLQLLWYLGTLGAPGVVVPNVHHNQRHDSAFLPLVRWDSKEGGTPDDLRVRVTMLNADRSVSVSYTHLTLPTNREV